MVIYDNSADSQTINQQNYPEYDITYIHDATNPGVSKAYNVAARIGTDLRKKWLLLTDQDTTFPLNTFTAYADATIEYADQVMFVPILNSLSGIYSPCLYHFNRGSAWPDPQPGLYSFKNKSMLNSGILIKINAFNSINGYDEKVKLYFSDFNFVDRLKIKYDKFVVINLICHHSLSDLITTDVEPSLRRFKYYCEGAFFSAITYKAAIWLFFTVLLRAIKLSFRYKDFRFVKTFMTTYLTS
ncbi:hypothetical protein ACFSYC_09660 [Mucilaginibacter antarcticus]|uniref:Glycosyl transferase family 2 n=2 Tax=Mucilaginibacter antarcticus TaxID=1855725 RepID=A0ABW5XPH2_9SPHI